MRVGGGNVVWGGVNVIGAMRKGDLSDGSKFVVFGPNPAAYCPETG